MKKIAIIMTIILGMISYSSFGQEDFPETSLHAALNPHSQPNIQTTWGAGKMDYYGSGSLDGISVTQADMIAANSGVYKYQLDVNGDMIVNSEDANLIQQYVNGEIDHLPGHWNMLNGIEKRSWLKKYLSHSKTKMVAQGKNPKWKCGQYSTQETIPTFGYEKPELRLANDHNWDENARWNIPMYSAATRVTLGIDPSITTNNDGHFINATLVGPNTDERFVGNPLKRSHWMFSEPQLASVVVEGDFSLSSDGPVTIIWYGHNPRENRQTNWQIVYFELGKNPEDAVDKEPFLVLQNPNKPDSESPVVTTENKTFELSQDLDLSLESVGGFEVTDNLDPNPTITYQDETSGNSSNYTITRTITATDASGNVGTGIQMITISDTTAPTATGEESLSFEYSKDLDLSSETIGAPTWTDNGEIATTTQSDTSTQVMDGTVGQVNYTVTRTWETTDEAGNKGTFVQAITVSDTTAPSADFPESITVKQEDGSETSLTGIPENVSDNSELDVTVEYTDTETEYESGTVIEREWTMTDIAGNKSSEVQMITVEQPDPYYLMIERDKTNLAVKYFSTIKEKVTVQVINLGGGRLLKTHSVDVVRGSNTILIPMSKSNTFNLIKVTDSKGKPTQQKSHRDF